MVEASVVYQLPGLLSKVLSTKDLINHKTHTHPHYAGVIQNYLSEEEEDMGCYVAVTYGCFVTAFLIEDFCKWFAELQSIFKTLSKTELYIFESLIEASMN